jgi:hypothetical protein
METPAAAAISRMPTAILPPCLIRQVKFSKTYNDFT